MSKIYEVLAPAGSLADLSVMLQEGPDAIYVGLEGFSSRPQYADMSIGDIEQAVHMCHSRSVKLYVAINANVINSQIDALIEDIIVMDGLGVDAVILTEFAIVSQLQGRLQHTAIHASTLMGVFNIETVRLLKNMGVSRIIFHANLYFDEIASITCAFPDMEYELVAEGGTCFNDIRLCRLPHSYIGDVHRLYCRSTFALVDNNTSQLTKAKEISEYSTRTAEIVGLYMAINITSFKIEGRTVEAQQRIPMVRDLKHYIRQFDEAISSKNINLKSYLHYFVRTNKEMR